MLVWKKLSSAKWEEIWGERLALFSERLSISALPGAKTIRLNVWELTPAEGKQLLEAFGGSLQVVNRMAMLQGGLKPRPPIKIRDRLVVASTSESREECTRLYPGRKVLFIPPALAFGTGDHATTGNCLRFLTDTAAALPNGEWEMLDLGCGTGLLAIAARALGAKHAVAGDFDPAAVRVAKDNVRTNAVTKLTVKKLDVLEWTPERAWDVITANIFAEILIKAAPRILKAVAPKGTLILSGILRDREQATLEAFTKKGKWSVTPLRKGKWVTLRLQKG